MRGHVPFVRLSLMGQEAQPAPAPDAFQQASNAAARTLQQPNIGKGVAIGVGIAVGVAALGKIMSSRERS